MKKSLFLLFMPLFSFSQFSLTPEGFKANDSKDYIILDMPGKSQADLFKAVVKYINKVYASPKDVISKVDNESITVSGYLPNSIHRNSMHVFNMDYTINFEFKDNKIKVAAPSFKLTAYNNHPQTLWLVADNNFDGSDLGIYNKKLNLKSERAKNDLEKFFNEVMWTKMVGDLFSYYS